MIKELKIVILTCFLFCNMSCKEEADILDSGSKEKAYIFNDFQHLEITYLFGQGHSDLMPPVIPDPVSISAAFEFRNIYDKKIVAGIYPEEAFLYLLPGGELIETMQMDLWYEIYISGSN